MEFKEKRQEADVLKKFLHFIKNPTMIKEVRED